MRAPSRCPAAGRTQEASRAVVILHDSVAPGAPPDALDVLEQARTVSRALKRLGWSPVSLPVTLDLAALDAELARRRPAFVFNLVETLAGQGRLVHLVPSLLDARAIPYTGAPAEALLHSSGKLIAKRSLSAVRIATPPWMGSDGSVHGGAGRGRAAARYIIKSVWEHGSVGIDAGSIVSPRTLAELFRLIEARREALGGEVFAEEYIAGREFNLSLLAGESGPEVLPPAELCFTGYAPDEPRLADYQAKWGTSEAERYAYRSFRVPRRDGNLVEQLERLAVRCWECFALAGYARVDFRVDGAGKPWVLEVNSNPCLSPDAGFAAAVARAGLTMTQAIARIVEAAGVPTG